MYDVTIIKTDGTQTTVRQPKAPTLEQLQKAVGGWIETVPYFTKFEGRGRGRAYANEEGLLKALPLNREATTAWRACAPTVASLLVGDVIFYNKVPKGGGGQ